MTVSTFFPDANPETTSVDGRVSETTDADWATIRAAAGDDSNPNGGTMPVKILVSSDGLEWSQIDRAIMLFDTAPLASGFIASAILAITVQLKNDDHTADVSLVESSPASNTNLVNADYAQVGTTKQASDVSIASITADSVTATTFTLNATGITSLTSTHPISKFGLRIDLELDDNEPSKTANEQSRIIPFTAEEAEAGDERPVLTVTWTVPILELQLITLMPEYDERELYGDIANMPYFNLALFSPTRFGPNSDGAISGPTTFDIIEGANDFELRTPL